MMDSGLILPGFGFVLTHSRARFGTKNGGPSGARFERDPYEFIVFALPGAPKDLHFGYHFGIFQGSTLAPFLGPLFWGWPAG